MNNYEEMSDTEINITMTVNVFGCQGWELSEGGGQLFHCGIDGSGYFAQEIVDFCNSWANMGPLIVEGEIGVSPDCGGDFLQWRAMDRRFTVESVSENPLRAAAIVYLMIKDSE